MAEDKDREMIDNLEEMEWSIDYGSVKVQLRGGKPTLVTIERTIKLD